MDTILFGGYVVVYLALLAWGLALAARHRWWTPANLPLLVVLGLIYDNAVISAGRAIGEGALLEGLSLGRFWIHALVTPLLVVFAWHALARSGAAWAKPRAAGVVAVVVAAGLVVLELTHVVGIELAPRDEYGALSYAEADPSGGPAVMVLLVSLALLVAGAVVWWRQRWPWLLVGTLLMVVGSAVEIPVESGAVTNAFEVVLLTSVLATKGFQDRAERRGTVRAD